MLGDLGARGLGPVGASVRSGPRSSQVGDSAARQASSTLPTSPPTVARIEVVVELAGSVITESALAAVPDPARSGARPA